MKEDKHTKETETERDAHKEAVDERSLNDAVREFVLSNEVTKFLPSAMIAALLNVLELSDINTFQRVISETTIPLRITEQPLTPQNIALAFTTLTELVTELWLIGKRRFADLVEYTQTHDVRFTNETGITIAWITYNSPFIFGLNIDGLNIDKVVPGLADAFMTIINGLTQRKARLQQIELENQATAQQIEEAKQRAYDASKMAELYRKEREFDLLLRQWEASNKMGAGSDIETGITIMLPIEDAATKSMSKQLTLPTVLQLSNTKGLELALPMQTSQKDIPKQDAGQ